MIKQVCITVTASERTGREKATVRTLGSEAWLWGRKCGAFGLRHVRLGACVQKPQGRVLGAAEM